MPGDSSVTTSAPLSSESSSQQVQPLSVPFYLPASQAASESIQSIRKSLFHFPTPQLRIQRVSQLDAELLDRELAEILLEPVKKALASIRSTLPVDLEPELLLFLKVALYKLSIYDRGASYGAMLQNLKYRNEWAHRGALQSTARDQPLSKLQLTLYPILTILLPYLGTKWQDRMTLHDYAERPTSDIRRKVWSLTDSIQRLWSVAVLVNFSCFLRDGKYRSVTDRMLGMRLTYSQKSMNRNVSFEYLNRQLVWHAFTEFLLFLLPIIRPKRFLRRLMRLPSHPKLVSFLLYLLPLSISSRIGLLCDSQGRPKIDRKSGNGDDQLSITSSSANDQPIKGKYFTLPTECCAICFERLDKESGTTTTTGFSMGIPNSDPLDPTSGLLAPHRMEQRTNTSRRREGGVGETRNSQSSAGFLGISPNGIAYVDALLHTPYQGLPCGCNYCYYCISSKLADEDMEDLIQDYGGWPCLRCNTPITKAQRFIEPVDDYNQPKERGNDDDDDDQLSLDELTDDSFDQNSSAS